MALAFGISKSSLPSFWSCDLYCVTGDRDLVPGVADGSLDNSGVTLCFSALALLLAADFWGRRFPEEGKLRAEILFDCWTSPGGGDKLRK